MRVCNEDNPNHIDPILYDNPTEFEIEYRNLLLETSKTGNKSGNRTEFATRKQFGSNTLHHSCGAKIGQIEKRLSEFETICPILVGRPIKFDVAWYETLMFLRGITDTRYLEEKGISIWKGNTTREFLDSRGLTDLPEKDLGKGYGYQWRSWNGRTDQLSNVIADILENPLSRRHVVSAWNPEENDQAALDPCHIMYQFNVEEIGPALDPLFGYTQQEDETPRRSMYFVDIQFYMRSSDLLFGLPFNMLMYYLILNFVCGYLRALDPNTDWIPRRVHYVSGDAHVYENQLDFIQEYRFVDYQTMGENHSKPKLILPEVEFTEHDEGTFDEYLSFIEQKGYRLLYSPRKEKYKTPRPKMAV